MSDAPIAAPAQILDFWFSAGRERWFSKDDAFDLEIRDRFMTTYEAAAARRLADWEAAADSALALIIVLDQFPRNMFRGAPRAFATDPLALAVAKRAVDHGFDRKIPLPGRSFFYMPFMHSEDAADQRRCIELARSAGDENTLKYARLHADIIDRFGRFPHRNAVLGRSTTAEEKAFLDDGGFAG